MNTNTSSIHKQASRSVYYCTACMLIAAIVFCIFVEISKQVSAAETISPFRDDPYDAVVSFTFQIVLLVGLLTFARLVSYRLGKHATLNQLHFILRGNQLIFASIIITLITDTIAEAQQSSWSIVPWGTFLVISLVVVAIPTVIAGVALLQAGRDLNIARTQSTEPFASDSLSTLGYALDDLLFLLQIPGVWLVRLLPPLSAVTRWIGNLCQHIGLATASKNFWNMIRTHAWRFCLLVALISGLGLSAAQEFLEGPPPAIIIVFTVGLFFFIIETIAVILGFLLLGGFLGLRPPLLPGKISGQTI
ncbi:MAG: hypothetical protein ABI406_15720 [Ktedonobacteraceae bacterium]